MTVSSTRSARLISSFWLIICALLAVSFCLRSDAQTEGKGNIEGRVKDAAGAFVPRAEVTIASLTIKTVSDDQGSFRMTDLPAGGYSLTVSYIGFSPITSEIDVKAARLRTSHYS